MPIQKKISIILLFLMFGLSLEAITVVSLGGDCNPAGMLLGLNIRKNAYPFDWIYAPFESVYQAFKDDFKRFIDPRTLKIGKDARTVVNYYGLQFVHDFPTIHHEVSLEDSGNHHPWAEIRSDWRKFIPDIKEKYERRITRLKELLTSTETVFFIYSQIISNDALEAKNNITQEDAIKLRDLLLERYPKLDFTLVMVTSPENDFHDWNLDRIKNFCMIRSLDDYGKKWLDVFQTLQIPFGINPLEESKKTE